MSEIYRDAITGQPLTAGTVEAINIDRARLADIAELLNAANDKMDELRKSVNSYDVTVQTRIDGAMFDGLTAYVTELLAEADEIERGIRALDGSAYL